MRTLAIPGLLVVGGGPAGLMAAETARAAGHDVDVFDAMGSVGRKFLVAGKGGLNLTHADPPDVFASRYREQAAPVAGWLRDFDAAALREWARGLGIETFVGTSGRVFPTDLKAAPLLRGWVRRLRDQGVRFHVQHRWQGFADPGGHLFATPDGTLRVDAPAAVLALGGASWPQLGSDGAWTGAIRDAGADVAPLRPANCGFDADWTPHFAARFAGAPVKPVRLAPAPRDGGAPDWLQGECVVSATGLEGSAIYALSARLRERIEAEGEVRLLVDLAPGRDAARLQRELAVPRGRRSLSEHLRRRIGLAGVQAGLLRECASPDAFADPAALTAAIKALPVTLRRPRPVAEAISTAGGVTLESLDDRLMLRARPGIFCAGEMLDWEAPTGGYLLTACFAGGVRAGRGAVAWLARDAD